MAYVIIDLFSCFVVGWMLASKECKHLVAQLFAETIARHGIEPGLQVHADRGSAMKSDTLAQLLAALGASRSFSRPRVSDDNAFSESQFNTMKYQPTTPDVSTASSTGAAGCRTSSAKEVGVSVDDGMFCDDCRVRGVRSSRCPSDPASASSSPRIPRPEQRSTERSSRRAERIVGPTPVADASTGGDEDRRKAGTPQGTNYSPTGKGGLFGNRTSRLRHAVMACPSSSYRAHNTASGSSMASKGSARTTSSPSNVSRSIQRPASSRYTSSVCVTGLMSQV